MNDAFQRARIHQEVKHRGSIHLYVESTLRNRPAVGINTNYDEGVNSNLKIRESFTVSVCCVANIHGVSL